MKVKVQGRKALTLVPIILAVLVGTPYRPPEELPSPAMNGTFSQANRLATAPSQTTRIASVTDRRNPTPKEEQSQRATAGRVIEGYGNLPLHFEANQGQTDEQVKFLSRGKGYTLFLTPTEAVMVLAKPVAKATATRQQAIGHREKGTADRNAKSKVNNLKNQKSTVLRVRLVGANRAPTMTALDELPGRSNYFIGNDPAKWRTNVRHYARVKYEGVYPGIDMIFYGNQQQLEYDFVVAPGADPERIQLGFEGAKNSVVDDAGHLVLHTTSGDIQLRKPVVYQEADGVKKQIDGSYVLNPKSKIAAFQLAAYDRSKPLIIDPVLSYATYLGGSEDDVGVGIAVDSAGNAYVVGSTRSLDFPTASGAFQTEFGYCGVTRPCSHIFVAKLNLTSSTLVYSTYLGGTGNDLAAGIALDDVGNTYLTGSTTSPDFPTTPDAFQPSRASCASTSCTNAFVTKLNSDGSALAYSTYLSANDYVAGTAIALDTDGNAYVTGWTWSSNFPTVNPIQGTLEGLEDAFVTKLNSTGSSLIYSTYLGGGGFEKGTGIAVDGEQNAYVTGTTGQVPILSIDFPTTPGAFQTTRASTNGDVADSFVAKLNSAGSALVYSTYLSGSGGDTSTAIAVDADGNAYVTGWTSSSNFPTVNPIQGTLADVDAFVTKLNSTGSSLIYSTYLGGSSSDSGTAIAVDVTGSAYVTGRTSSNDFPTANPLQTAFEVRGPFVAKLAPGGSALIYSTYLNDGDAGSGVALGNGIALDDSGDAYVTGYASDFNFPVTPGAFQISRSNCGGFICGDAFLAKIRDIPNTEPVIGVSPKSQDFGAVSVGSSVDRTFTVYNIGGGILRGSPSTSPPFSIVSGGSYVLTAGQTQDIIVRFSPTSPGTYTDKIAFSGGGGASREVTGASALFAQADLAAIWSGNAKSKMRGNFTMTISFDDSGNVTGGSTSFGATFTGGVISIDSSTGALSGTILVVAPEGFGACELGNGSQIDSTKTTFTGSASCDGDQITSLSLTKQTFILTVSQMGTGSGILTSSPAGIDCGTVCLSAFGRDTRVTLTLAPNSGSVFVRWSGCDDVLDSVCGVTMGANRSVTATFDVIPSVSINDVILTEGNSGTTSFDFTVTLSSSSSQVITVDYSTASGTATAGPSCTGNIDYKSTSGSLTFAPGETSKVVSVEVCGDTVLEPNETFVVDLTGATNAIIEDGQGVSTIVDNDTVIPISCSSDSLQAAVNSADRGQTLSVTGTCSENLLVRNDKVRVFLDGGGTAVIHGSDPTRPAIDVRGKAVSIQGFIITGGSSGIEIERGANAVIDSNVIDGVGGPGVVINQLAFAVLTDNTIQNNVGDGVVVKEGSAARIGFNTGNEVSPIGNTIQGNDGNGITVSVSSSARVVGNDISNNGGHGVEVMSAAQADISNNAINNNGGDGIFVTENSTVQLGEDPGLFALPNNGTGNAGFGIRCHFGGALDGLIGSLTGNTGPTNIDSSCPNSLSP